MVIAVGPAFGAEITHTIGGLRHGDVLRELLAGVADEGLPGRVIKVYAAADCAYIGHAGAKLSGSGVAVGLQSRGTTVIHRKDLAPLNNLELFPQSPSLAARSGRAWSDLTLANVREGRLGPDDFAINAETLRRQAALAVQHGYPELAANLRRAAELTAVPDDELLAIYEALRPGRATHAGLMDLAARLEAAFNARDTAAFIRDAAEAYRETGLSLAAES